jgi:ComF family protein
MPIASTANLFYDSLLALVYPQACAVCGGSVESRDLGVACANCWGQTRVFTRRETLCWKCGLPSEATVAKDKQEEVRCRRCDEDPFSAARACGLYAGALRVSVLSLKLEPNICRRVRDLLVETQGQYPLSKATRIIPVPLHPERQKARGFNQAAVIGQALSRATSIPLDEVSLIRTQHTNRHRAGMDARQRRETVDDAFRVSYPALITGERVLLVDDVFTTGATVSSCAQKLLLAGAKEVFVLTIARPLRS